MARVKLTQKQKKAVFKDLIDKIKSDIDEQKANAKNENLTDEDHALAKFELACLKVQLNALRGAKDDLFAD